MSSVKRDLIKGMLINFITKYSAIVIQIALSMILARLLIPEEFGIVAVITVISSFLSIIGQIGMGPAVIQEDLSNNEISLLFNFSLLLAAIIAVLFYFSGSLIADFYNNDVYIGIAKLLSISVFFNILIMIPGAVLRKEKKFLTIGLIEFFVTVLSGVISVTLAINNYSYYSLIISSVISSVLIFIFKFKYANLNICLQFSIEPVKKIYKYSFFQFLSNFFDYFSKNIDNLIVSKFMGEASLGIYDKAYKLMRYPVTSLVYVITPVIHPVLAEYKSNIELIYSTYKKMVKIMSYIGIPLSIFFCYESEPIVNLFYGSMWGEAIPILRIFSISLWVNMCIATFGPIYQSVGRTEMLFLSNLMFSGSIIIASVVGLIMFGELEGIAWCVTISFYFIFFMNSFLLVKKVIKKSYIDFIMIFFKPLLLGMFVTLGLSMASLINITSDFISVIVCGLILVICMIIGMFILEKAYFYEIFSFVRRKYEAKIAKK